MNPNRRPQKPQHWPEVTAWATMLTRGVICPYFFRDERGRTIAVNSERYVEFVKFPLTSYSPGE